MHTTGAGKPRNPRVRIHSPKKTKPYFSTIPVVSYHMALRVSNVLLCNHYSAQWERLQRVFPLYVLRV